MSGSQINYSGPSGEVAVGLPTGHRAGKAWRLWLVCGLLFLAWGGWYFFAPDQKAFLGTPLSDDHYSLRENCRACHPGLTGAEDHSCITADCHQKAITNNFHEKLATPCGHCHVEHANAQRLDPRYPNAECKVCHDRLKNDPQSKFSTARPQAHPSVIDRRIYSHQDHRGYHCPTCHGRGEGTINTPFKQLFTMKACNICHVEDDCQICHPYHGQRVIGSKVAKPADLSKLKQLKEEGVQLDLPPNAQPGGTP